MPIQSFGISPDGKQIVFSNEGKQEDLFLLNSNGSDLRQITNDVEKDRGPSWSRDGKRIYFYSHRGERYEIWSVRPDGSALEQVTSDAAMRPPQYPTMSPDGSRLLSFNSTGSYIWRFDRKRFEPLPRVDAQHVLGLPSWSPDGRSVVGLSARPNDANYDGVVIYSFQTNRFESISDENSSQWIRPLWLPDGKRVIYAHKDGLEVVDLATKQSHAVTPPIPGLRWCAISPDGRSLYVSTSRTDANIWLMSTRERR
jgi:Tol biopolymer transport system component